MTKLTIMRGVPGCGKSTAVEVARKVEPDIVVVSRDTLRNAFFGRERDVDEDFITVVEHQAIRDALAAGKHVISDNTNIQFRYVNALIKIAYEFDTEVNIVEMIEDLDTCILRNMSRSLAGGRFVPEDVIRRMYQQYKPFKYTPLPTFEPYEPDETKPKCILVDIDGTLAQMTDRGPYDWAKVGTDEVVSNLADLIRYVWMGMYQDEGSGTPQVIIFSGRDGAARTETEKWLLKYDIAFDQLCMRAEDDRRPDTIVKMEMFDAYIRDKFNCIGVFDDRPAVVRQWMKHNVPVYHVTPYAKDF